MSYIIYTHVIMMLTGAPGPLCNKSTMVQVASLQYTRIRQKV